jgi:acyl-CoA thioesterase
MLRSFDVDTRVTPAGAGQYSAQISDRWNVVGGHANGGYALAVCLSALRHEMPYPDPLSVSATYLRRTQAGPAWVHADLIRTGRRLAFGEARLMQDGTELVRVVASFTDLGLVEGRTFVDAAPPALPPPEDCVDLAGGVRVPGLSIAERLDFRFAELPGWRQGKPTGHAYSEFWMRFADGGEPDTCSLAVTVDMANPAIFELGEYSSATIELTAYVRARPEPGWLACRASTRYVVDGYHEEDFEAWDSAGRLVVQSRQLALLPRG